MNYAGNPTPICFTNQPWNFAHMWAAGTSIIDFAQVRLFNDNPAGFSALPGTVVAPPQFQAPVISNGQITLSWTGSATLQWASAVNGPWNTYTPDATSPYTEAMTSGNRFYRLQPNDKSSAERIVPRLSVSCLS